MVKKLSTQIEIEGCEKHEAGLLLLILKDLWTGDLAVGGEKSIGRGVFQGHKAKITMFQEPFIELELTGEEPNVFQRKEDQNIKKLQEFVDSLVNYSPQEG